MKTNKEKLKEDTHSVYELIKKDVLSPHQLFLWVQSLLKEKDQRTIELVESKKKSHAGECSGWCRDECKHNQALDSLLQDLKEDV